MPLTRQLMPTFLLLLAAALSSWLVIKSLEAPVNTPEPPQNPDAYMFNVSAVKMNALDGTPQDELFSPEMVHYPTADTTNVTTPHIIIFNSNGEEPWHIYADQGQARNGTDILQLTSNVRLQQAAGPHNQALIINTSAMTIYPDQQYAETDQPIKLWQPSDTATSVGLKAYQQTGIIDLLSQARGHYLNAKKN
jgi:lipopolysaccharide export system protein LptC